MTVAMTLLAGTGYLLAGRALSGARHRWRDAAWALLNFVAVYFLFFSDKNPLFLAPYVLLVCAQFLVLRWAGARGGWRLWTAFCTPLVVLVAVRYVPPSAYAGLVGPLSERLRAEPGFSFGSYFIGVSYLAFRTSYLVLEVRNGVVPPPGFWAYLGFAFFAPTLSVGPISPYSRHRCAFAETDRPQIPPGRALLRLLVGLVKFKFLGVLLNQLSYAGLLLDGHPHPWIDLPVAAAAYYLYLYCNFSGMCDIAIGAAGLMGISVAENFDNPLGARNMKDFWNRWHITLSHYMRDVVFSPLSKALVRALGPAHANQAVALTILVVFLLVGIWHGVGGNFVAFGAAQALGVVTVHYYTLGLKRWLGRAGYKAYHASRLIQALGVAITFCYFSATLAFFANTFAELKEILAGLR